MILQSELEIQEEGLRSHYGAIEEELHELKQEHQECQEYIDNFAIQMNSKIAKLDIEREELQRAKAKLAMLETMVRTLERSNEALGASNEVIITNNTLLHNKLRHMMKHVEQVARYAKRMQQQASQVGNSATKYREYLAALTSFIEDLANKGNAFQSSNVLRLLLCCKLFVQTPVSYRKVITYLSFSMSSGIQI